MNHSGGAMVRETHGQSDEQIGVALARVTLPLPPFDDKRHAILPLLIVCPQLAARARNRYINLERGGSKVGRRSKIG